MISLLRLMPLCLFLIISCSSRDQGWDIPTSTIAMSDGEVHVLKAAALKLWKFRMMPESLEECMMKFELLHSARPDDLETLTYLARGNYLLADAHVDNLDSKMMLFERAVLYGEKAMGTNLKFKEKMDKKKSFEEGLSVLTINEAPAMFWVAASLGKWAKVSGVGSGMIYKDRVKAMLARVEKLYPDYFFGAVPRMWGAFHAIDGDMTKSRSQFEKAMNMAPKYQGTKVLMADLYYIKLGDQKGFVKLLNEVLKSEDDLNPDFGPENVMEKIKAEKMMAVVKDIF